jgi:hypothetical protein
MSDVGEMTSLAQSATPASSRNIITKIDLKAQILDSRNRPEKEGVLIWLDDNNNNNNDEASVGALISSETMCCELFSVDTMDGDPSGLDPRRFKHIKVEKYIGATLLSVKWSHAGKGTVNLMFSELRNVCIEVTTSVGMFYVVIWNEHNGYYAHSYEVYWQDYKDRGDV